MSELVEKENTHLVVKCPHCEDFVLIEKLNCCIFRHGILKYNGKQMDPHATKTQCDLLIKNNEIYGCGKPFRIVVAENDKKEEIFIVEICDYI